MATNQEALQASIRTRSGNTANLTFNGDWHALFDAEAIAAGTFNERLLAWLNVQLVAALDPNAPYANLQPAQNAYAASKSVVRWSDLRDVT